MAGKTRVSVKTMKLRGKSMVKGGAGTATRAIGLLGDQGNRQAGVSAGTF